MKIAQFIASKGWGGAEKAFVHLCNALAEEHHVSAISCENPLIEQSLDPAVRFIRLRRTSRYSPGLYWFLNRHLKSNSYEIFHTHGAKATEIIHRINRILPLRHVATKHNTRKGAVFEKVRYVIAVGAAVAGTIERGAKVIPNGILPQPIRPGEGPHVPFRILAVGRLDPIKGFDRLIDQAGRLEIDYRLEILGDGPERENLQRRIDLGNLGDRIRLVGYCENIPERMSEADLLVISSHSEGFPLVLVESLFYAKVLISTPVGGVPEILDPALLVEPEHLAEKITAAAGDYAAFRRRFRRVQEECRDRFRIETVAKSHLEFYLSIGEHE